MKKNYLSKLFLLLFLVTSLYSYSTTYYSIANTAWTVPSTWSTVGCGGAAAATTPGAGDDVIICVGTTVTMNASPGSCNSLTINGTATWAQARTTNVGNGGIIINVGGNITGNVAGILTTTGGLTINAVLTSITVTIKTQTNAGQTISGTGTLGLLDISANTTNNGTLTVTSGISSTVASTLTQAAAATLNYKGASAIVPTLSANAAGNTVNYAGAAQTIRSATYDNLTISGSNTKTLGGDISVNNNLTVSAGSLYTSTYQITGNASGVFSLAAGTTFYIGNNGSATNVTFPTNFTNANISFSSSSTVYYYGNNGQTVSSVPTYGNLTIQTFAGSKTADGTITVAGNLVTTSPSILSMTNNTLALTGSYTGTGGLSFTSGSFNITGTYTNTGSFTCGTSTVTYNGGGAQTVRGVNYYNLTFSGAGAKTLQASATVGIAGDFTRGAMTVTIGSSNTVTFNGGVQNMTGNAQTFNNVTIANTSLTISNNITVNATLTFTTGSIITGANKVIIAQTGSVSRTSGHVVGNLRKYIATGSNVARTFEVGTGTDYAPIDITFASVSTAGNLTVSTTSGDHPQIATSGFNAAKTVNRYWTLTNSSAVYTTYNITGTFVNSDEDAGLTTSACSIKIYDGASWLSPIVGTQGANSTQATTIAIPVTPNTIDLQIGENNSSPTGQVYSIASGNWSSIGTWSATSGGPSCGCLPTNLDDAFIEGGFTVTMNGNSGAAKSLTIQTGGVATWTSALTTNIGSGGITITAAGNITGASSGILTTSGGLVLNSVLTSTSVTIKTMTTAGQTISGTGTLGRLDISTNTTNNGTITVSTLIASTVASTLTQGAGATLVYQGASAIAPALSANAAGNTVSYTGGNQTIKSATYQDLTIGGTNTKTLGGAITVNGDLTVNASTLYTSTYQITGNATGTFTLAAGTAFTIGNSASATNVLFPTNFITANISFSSTSTVSYAGNSAQTISSVPSYGTLRAYTFSGSKAADGTISVAGDLIITSPTIVDMSSYTLNLTGNYTSTGALSFTSGTFNITGSWTNTAAAFTSGTGTVNYNGNSAQTIRGYNYYNLTFSGTGAKTLETATTIGIAGATFARGTMVVTPGATNTVSFTGAAQNMTGNATTFTNVTINNTSITIPADITINGTLTFTAGNIITNANKVIIPAAGTVSRTSGHVVGNLRKNVATGANISRTFELGTGANYTPLDITFASVTTAGDLTASTTAGDHPQIASSTFDPTLTVNRYWTLTNSVIVYTNYNVTLTFVNADEDAGLVTSSCGIRIYDGAAWSTPVTGTQGANSTQATGITIPATPNTVDLQIGERACSTTGNLYSIATGNWNTASTWSESSGGSACSCTPTHFDNVVIENGFTVTMNGNSGAAKTLTINTGGVATWSSAFTTNVGTGGINIAATGDITGASAGILTTAGGLTLNKALSSSTVTIKTMTTAGQTITGTGTLAKLETSVNTTNNGNITLTDVLTVSGGTFTNSGTFTLQSTALKYARIAAVTGGGAFAGNFTIERYLPSRTSGHFWADLSSPASTTMADWDNELFLVYPFTAYWSDRPEGSNVYPYDEPSALYVEINAATALSMGEGFEIGLVDDATDAGFTARTLTSVGTPYYGDKVIPVSYTAANGGAYALDPVNNYSGENLVGNPFASAVDLGQITLNGTLSTFDVLDETTQNYIQLTTSDIIGPYQGFWAYTSGNASGTITIPESAKVSSSTTDIRSAVKDDPFLQLTLSSADGTNSMAHTFKVVGNPDARDGWDLTDHPFRKSPNKDAPSIYALIEGKKAVINTFNSSNETYSIPLFTHVGISGKYKIEVKGFNFVSEYTSVKLEDRLLNKMIDLTEQNVYSFQINANDKNDRFILHLSKNKDNTTFGTSSNIISDFVNGVEVLPAPKGNIVNFNLSETVNTKITLTNLIGQDITNGMTIEANNQSVNILLPEGFSGMYLIKIESSKGAVVKKFIKN